MLTPTCPKCGRLRYPYIRRNGPDFLHADARSAKQGGNRGACVEATLAATRGFSGLILPEIRCKGRIRDASQSADRGSGVRRAVTASVRGGRLRRRARSLFIRGGHGADRPLYAAAGEGAV